MINVSYVHWESGSRVHPVRGSEAAGNNALNALFCSKIGPVHFHQYVTERDHPVQTSCWQRLRASLCHSSRCRPRN